MTMEIIGAVELVADMGRAVAGVVAAATEVTQANGDELREEWKANARRTAGKHGKWYPSSITSERVPEFAAVTVEIGPDKARRQGAMGPGFEYGSIHQPPHLDGQKATDAVEPKFIAKLELAVARLL